VKGTVVDWIETEENAEACEVDDSHFVIFYFLGILVEEGDILFFDAFVNKIILDYDIFAAVLNLLGITIISKCL